MSLQIPVSIIRQLLEQAQLAYPLEIVGILAGKNQLVTQILPLENIALRPESEFVANPEGLLRALKHLKTQELELIAFYHSHPNGPATPSRTDFLESRWEIPMLIIDAKHQTARAWQLETGLEVRVVCV